VQPARSDGGQRRYSRHQIGKVQRVVQLADEGLTLEGIRRLMILEDQVAELRRELEEERAKRRS
jgi:DNA-binding transcriptional MerR regulator